MTGGFSRQLARQLYTLGFAAGKRRGGLTKPQITKPDLTQRAQAIVNRRNIIEQLKRFIDGQVQQIGDAQTFVLNVQSFAVVAPSLADRTRDKQFRDKIHFKPRHAFTGASFAAPAPHIEGKAIRLVAAHTRFGQRGKKLAKVIVDPGIGRGIGTLRAADRVLINADRSVELLPADELGTGVIDFHPLQPLLQAAIKDLHDQRAFPRAGHAGHAGHNSDRNLYR